MPPKHDDQVILIMHPMGLDDPFEVAEDYKRRHEMNRAADERSTSQITYLAVVTPRVALEARSLVLAVSRGQTRVRLYDHSAVHGMPV